MGFKQPRVPEYQNGESAESYIRKLVLFLKDFCTDVWTESRMQDRMLRQAAQKLDSMDTTAMKGEE